MVSFFLTVTNLTFLTVVVRRHTSDVHQRQFSEFFPHSPVRERLQPAQTVTFEAIQLDASRYDLPEPASLLFGSQQVPTWPNELFFFLVIIFFRLVAELDTMGYQVVETQSFTNEVTTALSKLKEKDTRIILGTNC